MKSWIVVLLLLGVLLLATFAVKRHHVSNGTGDSNCVSEAVCAA
jgi:hypothetical protein